MSQRNQFFCTRCPTCNGMNRFLVAADVAQVISSKAPRKTQIFCPDCMTMVSIDQSTQAVVDAGRLQ